MHSLQITAPLTARSTRAPAWTLFFLLVSGCSSTTAPPAEEKRAQKPSVAGAEKGSTDGETASEKGISGDDNAQGSAAASAQTDLTGASGSATPPVRSDAARSGAAGSPASSGFVLGNAVAPFDPPPLAEVDAQAQWQDNPIRDSLEALRAEQAAGPPPSLSASEALALRNDDAVANAKLLDALGRVASAEGTEANYDAMFVRHVTGDLKSTNPLFASSVTEAEYGTLTGISLLSFDRKFDYFGPRELVKSWQTSADGLMDKIVMRDDLAWSDGKPITAHDVEFTFRLIMTDHDELVIPAVRQGVDQLKFVKAYDDQTLVYFHKEPLAISKQNLLFPLVPKHIYEQSAPADPSLQKSERHRELEEHPVTGGAYELVRWTRASEFVVRRREGYFMHDGRQVRPKPYLAEIRVKVIEDSNTALLAVKAGDIEETILRPEQWTSQTNDDSFYRRNTKVTGKEWVDFHFVWNLKSRYFADKRVRWAMSYAMDHRELLETICHNLYAPGRGVYHPDSWMFPADGPSPIEQDLDKAETLLDEAGWFDSDGDGIRDKTIGEELVPFEFNLMTYQTDLGVQTATLMKECLDRIGVLCNVKPTEFAVMMQKNQDHEFDASMGGWGTGTDPYSTKNIYGSGENRNYGLYSNPRVDELFVLGERERDREKRGKIYGEIHKLLWEDQIYTWLFYRNSFYAFNKKLRGYNFSPRGPYDYSPGVSSIFVPAQLP